jgi:hypothetical protein
MRNIKHKILGSLLCLAVLTPISGQASLVTVEFAGIITSSHDPVTVGGEFSVSVSLDTGAALLAVDSGGIFDPGLRYRYDPSDMSMIVSLPGLADISIVADPALSFSLIYVRDNAGGADLGDGVLVETDGISLSVQDAAWQSSIIIRGLILDMFDGGGIAPGLFDPRLLDQELTAFQFGNVDFSENYIGTIDSFRVVPLPAAVWLFGSALLGLAGVSRRRQQR